jgi:hypothetical protein
MSTAISSFKSDEETKSPLEAHTGLLKSISETSLSVLNVLGNILNLSLEDSRAAREAAAESARGAMGGAEGVPDAKVEEAKAGGFFTKMGRAVMNPVKALGSGMKSIGKGIEGILTGIARGLMAFANPLVLVGVSVLALSLPIFAAGLAAAFKVFDEIAGKGAALEFVTGIIESLGEAVGTILEKILIGIGKMIKEAGPGITDFFDGLAVVIKALHPIIVDIFKVIKDIITDPVLNETIQAVIKAIETAITAVKEVIVAFAPVIESIFKNLEVVIVAISAVISNIVTTVGSVIEKILGSFDNVVNQIEPIIKAIGTSISGIIDSISAGIEKLGTSIEGIINSIGDNVKKVIDSISALITAIGKTIEGVIDSIVTGIERLSGLDAGNMAAVAGGLALLAGGLVLFSVGAMIGGAAMPSKETLEGIAKSVEKFGAIDSANLAPVGTGMAAIGKGLAVFGVGGKLAELLKTEEGGLDSVAKSVEMFGKIDSTNLSTVGTGMKDVGVGLLAFGAGGALAALLNDPKGLEGVATSVEKFGLIDGSNFAMVGDGITSLGKGLATFGAGGLLAGISEGLGKFFGASDPVEKFQKFAKIGPGLKDASAGIKGLATAMNVLGESNIEKTAEALDDFMKKVDMDKLTEFSKAMGSMVGNVSISGDDVIPGLITETNLLLKQGFITGPSGLFANPSLAESSFELMKGQQTQIDTGHQLAELQTESNSLGGTSATTVIVNNEDNSLNNQSSQPLMLPTPAIAPGNGGINLPTG